MATQTTTTNTGAPRADAPVYGAAPRKSWRTTLSNALIITRREVRDSFRDWRIIAPIIILTFLFPGLAQFVAQQFADFLSGYGAQIIGERTIPFLLMVVGFFPISISLVIALETFVGEKERRSLEPLLSTPLTNTEMYIGKTLAAMIPPLVASFGGMAVYLVSLLSSELAWRPAPMLIFQIVMLTTVQALVMVTGAVVVSSQTTSTRAANLLASFIIIPMALVIQGESVIMFLAPDAESPNGISALWAIIVGMMLVVVLFLRLGNSIFNREELLGRSIDAVNLRSAFRRLRTHFLAVDDAGTRARGVIDWYRRGVALSLRRARVPIMIASLVFALALAIGIYVGTLPQWQLPLPAGIDRSAETFKRFINPQIQTAALGFIVWNNLRVLLAVLLLSIFSFGVVALSLTPAVYVILGYIVTQVVISGNSLGIVAAAVIPHGIIEIPVAALAAGMAFRLGAIVTRPPAGMTVGQAWLMAAADTLRVGVGVIVPGLFVSAFIEAFITPQIVLAVLGG
jgi:uncharacterized membrane protein SpoIIM required for sporulation/ABC-type transport system involved in multi-copper enzyme maturation permease subunit